MNIHNKPKGKRKRRLAIILRCREVIDKRYFDRIYQTTLPALSSIAAQIPLFACGTFSILPSELRA